MWCGIMNLNIFLAVRNLENVNMFVEEHCSLALCLHYIASYILTLVHTGYEY